MTRRHTLGSACAQIVDCEHRTAPIDASGEYFAVGTPAMKGNTINYEEARRISKEIFDSWTRRLLPRAGDLLFAREAPVGPIVRIPPAENIAPGQRTVLLRPDPNVVDSNYLYYLLLSPQQRDLLKAKAAGSTVAHLNVADVRSFELPHLPSAEEQRAIGEVLGALDDKIAVNITLVRKSDELADILARSSVDAEETMSLSDVAVITMGSSPPGTSYNEEAVGTVFYQGVRDFGVRYPSNRVWTTIPVRLAQKNDTLLSVRAPVGELNLAAETTCIGRGLASVRSSDNRPMSLFHLLKDSPQVWAPYEAEGTVFGSINKQQLQSLRLPAVRSDRREDLEHELQALELRIVSALEESDQLAATRDALLPELMSGKVRVKDAEKTVEEVL